MRFLIERKLNESGEHIEYKGYDLNISDIGSLEDIRELGTGTITIDVEVYKDDKRLGTFRGLKAARTFVDKQYFNSMKTRLINAIESWECVDKPFEYYTGPNDDSWSVDLYNIAEYEAREDLQQPGIICSQFGVTYENTTGNADFERYVYIDYAVMFSKNMKPFDYDGKWEVFPLVCIDSNEWSPRNFNPKYTTGGPYLEFPFEDIKRELIKSIEKEDESDKFSFTKQFIKNVEKAKN